LLCGVLSGCGDCEGSLTPKKVAAPVLPHATEAKIPNYPPPEGSPVSTDVLTPLAPESIGEFKAYAAVEPRTTPIGRGGTLTTIRRDYTRDKESLQLEITDALHAPALLELINGQQGKKRMALDSTFRGGAVAGVPAVVQWQGSSHTAIANLLVENRIVVNLRLRPASSSDQVEALAALLPLQAVTKVAATPPQGPAVEEEAHKKPPAPAASGKPATAAATRPK
jgi:hypothetical protein